MRFLFLLFLLLSFSFAYTSSDNTRDFSPVPLIDGKTSLNDRAALIAIGNSFLCKNSDDDAACSAPTIGATNNSIDQHKAKYDASLGISHTMARLDLNSSDTIVWAGLYWSARIINGTTGDSDYSKIKFRTPSSTSWETITSDPAKYNWKQVGSILDYACMQDVTTQVKAGGVGQYLVGDVQATNGSNTFAAWTLVVVVKNDALPLRNITVFDGFKSVYGDSSNYPTSVTQTASGFLTPNSGVINTFLTVFTGESESGLTDGATLTTTNGSAFNVTDSKNPVTDLFNGSITNDGVHRSSLRATDPTLAYPNFQNAVGTDIDTIKITQLDHFQTSTDITIRSGTDRYSLNMFAFQTDLYEPKLCYDYSYSQNSKSFTEDNNGSKDPRLVGDIIPNNPIKTAIYIRNLESDIPAKNLVFKFKDLNTTQATLMPLASNVVAKTAPGGLVYLNAASDTNYSASNTDFNITLTQTLETGQGIYVKFHLIPKQKTIDIPLNLYLDYDLKVGGSNINYPDRRLSTTYTKKIELCTQTEYSYQPEWGRYNVIDHAINTHTDTTESLKSPLFYNLFTQVSNRPFEAEVVSFDPDNLDNLQSVSDIVGVEIIDSGSFHDLNASCSDPDASLTPKVWVPFYNAFTNNSADQNTTHVKLDLQKAITQGLTTATLDNFYNHARQSSTFRIWYFSANDANATKFNYTFNADLTLKVDNFSDVVKDTQCGGSSSPIFVDDGAGGTTNLVSTACSGISTGMTRRQFRSCATCLFPLYAKPLCSRDNFATRPESLKINIYDTDHSLVEGSASRFGSKQLLSNKEQNLSAGYLYTFDINATSHTSSNGVPGYTQNFRTASSEKNATLYWEPLASTVTLGCNDRNNTIPTFDISNGVMVNQERKNPNVGRYRLNLIDKTWTSADVAPNLGHQQGSHFLHTGDCVQNSNVVPSTSVAINNTNIGCDISSNHTNEDNASFSTSDYNLTFKPYKLSLNAINYTYGKDDTSITANDTYIYMSNLSDINSTKMGVHYKGALKVQGEDNSSLSNFVNQCYAQDIQLNLSANLPDANATVPQFEYRLVQTDANSSGAIYDSNDTNYTQTINLNSSHFSVVNKGAIYMDLTFNYNRNMTKPYNIQTVHFQDFNVSCAQASACQSQANLSALHNPDSNITVPSTLFFSYGRIHSPRYRTSGTEANIKSYYEVYCDLGNTCKDTYKLTQESLDDINWYVNPHHDNATRDGAVSLTVSKDSAEINLVDTTPAGDLNGIETTKVTYSGELGFPFKIKMVLTPDPWLLFNRFDANATTNHSYIEYFKTHASWGGHESNVSQSVHGDAANITNRRINW